MLEGLDTIDWESLTHAYGEATDVPGMLRSLLSEDSRVRVRALADLHSKIWHQGTVYPASAPVVPFLFELLKSPHVQDKEGIVSLLGCIATGEGELAYGLRVDGEETLRRWLAQRGQSLEEALVEEAAAMKAIHRVVSAELQHLLPYLNNPENELPLAHVLGGFPEHASWLVPAIDEALASQSNEHVRQALAESKARLTSGCSGPAAQAAELGRPRRNLD